jgi:hypothetical protein
LHLYKTYLKTLAVAALGIVKGKETAAPNNPGLVEIARAALQILPVQGSKALHDEIKVLLEVCWKCSIIS